MPMSIVLYKDKDGSTIPYDFVTRLDPPPKGFEIIDSPYLPENALDKAKHLIDDFCREEYQREDGADYTDLTNVGIAYTTTEDDKHEIQARVNLVDFRIETLADGKVVRSVQYSSIEELTEKGLQALSFDDLVSFLQSQGEQLIRAGQEYRWKRHDSLTVWGNKWYRHSQSKGGAPVDFVMEFFGKSFTEAVELLTGEKGAAPPPDRPSPAPISNFRLPPRSPDNRLSLIHI